MPRWLAHVIVVAAFAAAVAAAFARVNGTGFDVVGREAPDLPPMRAEWQEFGPGFRLLPHLTDTDGMVLVRYRRRP